MNKTWSIILIVVACIVVLGGTYWYFGMQKPKTQEVPTPSAVVEPAKAQPPAKASSVVAPTPKAEPTLPKPVVEPQAKPDQGQSPAKQAVAESLPAETPAPMKRIPAPIAPSITQDGSFALPSSGGKGGKAAAGKEALTSVLASEALPAKAEVITLPPEEDTQDPLPAMLEETPVVASAEPQEKEASKQPEIMGEEPVETVQLPPDTEKVILPPAIDEPVGIQPEAEQETPATETPQPVAMLRSETISTEEMATTDKPALEANLSVSFLDYNFPADFSSSEKGFKVSLDVLSQNEVFGWGGTLEAGKNTKTDVVQISLLGKAVWRLGRGIVSYPLSVSLGPTIFIDSTANTTEFGIQARFGAGATYAISESFRMFYAVGVGATYNFQDSSSFRFVLEPIRVGVGFSF